MATWTFVNNSALSLSPITAVVSAETVDLALHILVGELLANGIYLDNIKVQDLIPLPTQTRKARILSNGDE
jgi:hypothetical protein